MPAWLERSRSFLTRHIDQIVSIVTVFCTAAYVAAYFLFRTFRENEFLSETLVFLLSAGAFISSFLLLLVVMAQPREWFGNVAPFRFHLVIGCGAAILATASQLIRSVQGVLPP